MTDQKTYLGDRTKYFGASDMPAMRGNCDFTSREMLIAKKRGDLKSYIEDTHYIDRGNKYEDEIFEEISQFWADNNCFDGESQATFVSNLISAKCHLDGYFVEYQGNKRIVHIYEMKSKTVDTKTDFQDLADDIKANPPVKYLDQMELQYMLTKLELDKDNIETEYRMHLVVGLFRGRSNKCTGTVEVDVTDIITSIDMLSLTTEIIQFWKEVEEHDGKYSAETMLEIARVNAKLSYQEMNAGTTYSDVVLDSQNDEHDHALGLCQDYRAWSNKVSRLKEELDKAKDEMKKTESEILKAAQSTASIDCGDFKLEITRGVDNGRYTKAKEASYSEPKKFEKIKLISKEL